VDLKLEPGSDPSHLRGVVVSATGIHRVEVALPPSLLANQSRWWQLFEAHYGGSVAGTSAAALQSRSDALVVALSRWLDTPAWQPLQQALAGNPAVPLRLALDDSLLAAQPELELMPWECLQECLGRPIWRLVEAVDPGPPLPARHRMPRLLLVLGHQTGLDLTAECLALRALHRRGRIVLHTLSGRGCSPQALHQHLRQEQGWDALLFLGHSEADSEAGGRLQLGDGSWIRGVSLAPDLSLAARQGLQLVLLNSCRSVDLARVCLRAGIAWA
jgi:hypothetical protein